MQRPPPKPGFPGIPTRIRPTFQTYLQEQHASRTHNLEGIQVGYEKLRFGNQELFSFSKGPRSF